MTINHYNGEEEHPGIQPIRVLRHNIVDSFQNYNSSFKTDFPDLSARGFITANIDYHINDNPIFYGNKNQLPYIENGTINLSEIFLTYLWCICFAIHTPYYIILHEKSSFDKIQFFLRSVMKY